MSGSSSSTRQSATRRFSPPERCSTRASPGRQPQRVHRDLDLAVQLPQVAGVDLVLQLRLLLEQRVICRRRARRRLHADLVEAPQQVALVLDRLLDVAAHVERGVELRLLRQVADARALGIAQASPLKSLSSPAMMRSSELLPLPLEPTTPIFAPG
jgi:hypothetical protein